MLHRKVLRRVKYAIAALVVVGVLLPAIVAAHVPAWVLWRAEIQGATYDPATYEPMGGWPTFDECVKVAVVAMERYGKSFRYTCLPDTVDPRPRA